MKRKEFLALSALGFLGISCKVSGLTKPSQNLGIQLYTIRDAVSKNLEQALEKLTVLGFTNLEIYGYDGTFFGKTKSEFQSVLKNTGLKVISSHHQTGVVNPQTGTLLHDWEKTVEDLDFIGTKYMVCSYLVPEERTSEHYKRLPEILNKSGEITENAGIQFAYHNHDFEFEKLDDGKIIYDFILDNTLPESVKMELDLYWISKAGFDAVDYFKRYSGRFPLWHVKDMKADTKDFSEIGNGTIDFKRIFEAGKDAGLEYWFLEQDSSDKDIFESIQISKKFIERNEFFY